MLGANHNDEVFGVRSNLSGNHRGKERERKDHNQMQKKHQRETEVSNESA